MDIRENASLKPYNTFGIDAHARHLCIVHTVEELQEVLRSGAAKDVMPLVLGGGSNVLFTGDVDRLVILNRIGGIDVVHETGDTVYVRSGAGEVWHGLVRWCVDRGYGGIENMSLIPGCVGAGPIQNIGAYGAELKDVFHELTAVAIDTAQQHTFGLDACRLGYRDSIFKHEAKGRYVIATVTLRLDKNPKPRTHYGSLQKELERRGISDPGIREVSDAVIAVRQSKLPEPAALGNAGSFFKNPEVDPRVYESLKATHEGLVAFPGTGGRMKLSAGWLIEQCGWKGRRVGNTGAHKDQALVLVNYGGATGDEVYGLAMAIRESVKEKFGVVLETEVNVI